MKKNSQTDQKRIEIAVKLFIDTEIERYKQQKQQYGLVGKYFRYVHLGNRLVRKISAARNTTFILRSVENDLEIKIVKENGHTNAVVTIKNNELCWLPD